MVMLEAFLVHVQFETLRTSLWLGGLHIFFVNLFAGSTIRSSNMRSQLSLQATVQSWGQDTKCAALLPHTIIPSLRWLINARHNSQVSDTVCLGIQRFIFRLIRCTALQLVVALVSPVDSVIQNGNSPWLGATGELSKQLNVFSI